MDYLLNFGQKIKGYSTAVIFSLKYPTGRINNRIKQPEMIKEKGWFDLKKINHLSKLMI